MYKTKEKNCPTANNLAAMNEIKQKKSIREKLKTAVMLILNPHFLICFGLAWIITNGWAYIIAAIGAITDIGWMIAVSGAYLALLWLPFTPEKVITAAIAIVLLRALFPHDKRTLGVLRGISGKVKHKKDEIKEDIRAEFKERRRKKEHPDN